MTQDVLYPEEVQMHHCARLLNKSPAASKKVYLACPYSAWKEDGGMDHELCDQRFQKSCEMAAVLMKLGHMVFSPISHSVPIAKYLKNYLDHDFWLKQELPFIHWCEELWVYKLPEWDKSKEIKREIEYARKLKKPIVYVELEDYTNETIQTS